MINPLPTRIKTKSPLYFGLFCLLLMSGCQQAKTPEGVTRQFWEALIEGDIAIAQSYATQTSRQQVKKDPGLNLDQVTLKIGSIRIDGQQASVQTLFVYSKQKQDQSIDEPSKIDEAEKGKPDLIITTYLSKENGQWKVDYQKTARMIPGKALNDLMHSLNDLTQSFQEKLEEQAPLIEEKIKSLNERLIEEIEELSRQLEQSPEKNEKPAPPETRSI